MHRFGYGRVNAMDIIEELYYGNITPDEKSYNDKDEYKQVSKDFIIATDNLLAKLDKDQRELYNEVMNKQVALSSFIEKEKYIDGFKTGANLMLSVLKKP